MMLTSDLFLWKELELGTYKYDPNENFKITIEILRAILS